MRKLSGLALSVVVIASCRGNVEDGVAAETVVVDSVNVLPMSSDTALMNRAVVIRGGRVAQVLPAGVTIRGSRRIVARGRWLMPGLWDMHVHLLSSTDTQRIMPSMRALLGHGVVGARDMGSLVDTAARLLPLLRTRSDAPELAWVGPLLDGAKFQWSQRVSWHMTTPSEAAHAVDSLHALGVTQLKIYGSLGRREFDAVVATARTRGLTFGGHLPRGVTPTQAAAVGMRTLEHAGLDLVAGCTPEGPARVGRVLGRWVAEGYGARYEEMESLWRARDTLACAAQARAIAGSGMFVTPTLVLELKDSTVLQDVRLALLDSASRGYCRGTMQGIMSATAATRERVYHRLRNDVRELSRAGVRLLAGTDLGNPCITPGASLHDELAVLVSSGVSVFEVLRSATVNAAAALDADASRGLVSPGYSASLVLVSGDPRRDPGVLRTPAGVLHRGTWHDSLTLAGWRSPNPLMR